MTETEINERFCNFSPETLDAIRNYQRTRDPQFVHTIVHGVIEKYLPQELREHAPDSVQSFNAFGIESVTLMEIMLDIQDALGLYISDAELRNLHSFEEATKLLIEKVNALRGQVPT